MLHYINWISVYKYSTWAPKLNLWHKFSFCLGFKYQRYRVLSLSSEIFYYYCYFIFNLSIYGILFNTCIIVKCTLTDCFCWEAKVQCKFPTSVPADQGDDILNICGHSGHFDCASPHDIAGHCSLHSCFHANWMGNASGQ